MVALSNLLVYIRIVDVLAVPEPPTSNVFCCPGSFLFTLLQTGRVEIFSIMNSALVESDVGIKSYENWILFGGTQDSASQSFHWFALMS